MKQEIDFKSLGFFTKEMYDFPKIINVEVYRGDCPCSCVHCPVGITETREREERFGKKGMDLNLFKKIIKEVSNHSSSALRIHSVGEPLMWKNLVQALKIARDKGIKSWIFTSAVTNDRLLLQEVCENSNIVEVSVNSINSKDYFATKGIDAFKIVYKNIEEMHKYIRNKKISTRLIVSRVQSLDKNADEEFVKFWKETELVDDAFIRTYHTYNDLMTDFDFSEIKKEHQPCLVHWARFNISVDGYAVICFNELFKPQLDPSLILGDINKQTIDEIWHEPKLTSLRKAELSGDYSNLSFSQGLPCKNCYSCQPLYGNKETSEHQLKQITKK